MKNLLRTQTELALTHSKSRLGNASIFKTRGPQLTNLPSRSFLRSSKQYTMRNYSGMIQSFVLIAGASYLLTHSLKSNQPFPAAQAEALSNEDIAKNAQRLVFQIKPEHLQPNANKQVLFVLYDNSNPLHVEFLLEGEGKLVWRNILQKYPNVEIVHVNINSKQEHLDELLNLVEYKREKISKKHKPTLFIRADDRISKHSATVINEKYQENFNKVFQKESSYYVIHSVKDLADNIGRFNKNLNDTTIVYFNDPATENDEATKTAIRLMRQESENPILVVRDKDAGEKMRMEKGKFYVYYKPSFVNGFENFIDKDINFNYLQAYEGVCRDEFTVNPEYVTGEEFKTILSKYKGIHTERFAIDIFDQCFQRSFNVEFALNPNFSDFRKKYKHGGSVKPLLFIYAPQMYMSRYIGDFKEVLRAYNEVFDIYYTGDYDQASQLFYLKEFPEIFPYVVVVDTNKKKAVKGLPEGEELSAIKNNFYFHKYREIIFFNRIQKDLNKLVESFMDGEAQHFFQSERRKQETRVKKICTANFEEEIVKNDKVKQCIIEVFKHDCPSCSFNGKCFNAVSQKLEKHGYLSRLPLYRLAIDNKVPWLGNFGYSPIYLYLKKQGNEIVELKTISPPQRAEDFLSEIQELTKLKGFSDKIKLKPREQILKHIRLEDINEDFDIDFDTKEEEKPKEEQQPPQTQQSQQPPAN